MKIDKRKLRPTKRDDSLTTPAKRNAFFAKHLADLKPELEQLIISGLSRSEIIKKLIDAGFPKINPATLTRHLKELMPELYAKHLGRKTKAVATPAPVAPVAQVAPPTAQAVQTVQAQAEAAPVPQGQQLNNLDEFKAKLFNIATTAQPLLTRNSTPESFYNDIIKDQKRRFDNDGNEVMGWALNKTKAAKGFNKDLKLDAYNLIEASKTLLTESEYTYLNYYLEQIGFNK